MSDDPRWREVIRLFRRLKAAEGAPAGQEFSEGLQKFVASLGAIAADPAAASRDRSAAQRMLDQMAAVMRRYTPELIHKVVEMAGNEAAAPDTRAEARRLLDDITARLPAASDKLH